MSSMCSLSYPQALELTKYKDRPTGKSSSVKNGSTCRVDKAWEQFNLSPISIDEVCDFVNEFLEALRMKPNKELKVKIPSGQKSLKRYIKESYLDEMGESCKNLIWLKFTEQRHIGVVAAGFDFNFRNNNTAGIIIQRLNQKWDTSFLLIFPLIRAGKKGVISKKERDDIETGIGNYLIEKGVPILDYYSHRW